MIKSTSPLMLVSTLLLASSVLSGCSVHRDHLGRVVRVTVDPASLPSWVQPPAHQPHPTESGYRRQNDDPRKTTTARRTPPKKEQSTSNIPSQVPPSRSPTSPLPGSPDDLDGALNTGEAGTVLVSGDPAEDLTSHSKNRKQDSQPLVW